MNFLDNYLSLKYFFIAFSIGIFMVYISEPIPDIIIKYPTPENVNKIIYQDSADICYKYDKKEVSCPKDGGVVIPLQHDKNEDNNNKSFIDNIYSKIN